jgi:hypothetical protein
MHCSVGLLSVVFPTLLGWSLVRVFDRRQVLSEAEHLSLGGALGIGFLAWWMLLLDWFSIPFTRSNLVIPMAIASIPVMLGRFRSNRSTVNPSRVRRTDAVLLAVIAVQLLTTTVFSLLRPIEVHDAVFNWGLKSKAIFLGRAVPMRLLETNVSPNPTYPLLMPLAQSYVSLFLGEYDDFCAKWICVLLFMSFLGFLYFALRRTGASLRTGLFAVLVVCTIPQVVEQVSNGYADLPVGIYFGLAGICFCLWLREESHLFMVLAALFSAFAALTKDEGLAAAVLLFCCFVTAMLARRKGSIAHALTGIVGFVAIFGVLLLPWLRLKIHLELAAQAYLVRRPFPRFEWGRLERLWPIFYQYQLQWFSLRNWNLLWVFILVALAVGYKRSLRGERAWIGSLLLGQLMIYTMFYILVPDENHPVMNLPWYLMTTVSRMLLQLTPLSVFFLASLLASLESRGRLAGAGPIAGHTLQNVHEP